MIDPQCLGPDVDRLKISSDATIRGESYLTGPATSVAAGAVIESSRLENATVAFDAKIIDSIVTVELPVRSHHCDAAGRFLASGTDIPQIGARAVVQSSTLINSSVEADTSVENCWISNSHLGQRNRLHQVKMILCNAESDVTLFGPTEFSESHLGHGLSVDQCGFFEAVFSNSFHQLDFDATVGRLVVRRTITLPHASRYGQNVICSTNSGRLRPEKEGKPIRSLGPKVRLWHDSLLSHELIRVEPCCWVSDWTKLIGESAAAYETDEAMMNDRRATLVMPFAVAGLGGDAVRGLIMPGERAIGIRPDQRFPAWTFTYAPGAVIEMVRRVHRLLPPEQQEGADTLVNDAIRTARAMVQAVRCTEQDRAWHDWADQAETLLAAHLESDLWQFEAGEPCEWRQDESGRWIHPRLERLLQLVPDMLDAQVDETSLCTGVNLSTPPLARLSATVSTIGPTRKLSLISPLSFTKQATMPTIVDPSAQIADDVTIGPGCQIGPGVVIGGGTRLWNVAIEASEIGQNCCIERCCMTETKIGSDVMIRSSVLQNSQIGDNSTVDAASIVDSSLGDRSTISALGDLKEVTTKYGTILGGRFESARIDTFLMSMHMAGRAFCVHAEATPVAMEDGRIVPVHAIPMIGGGARCDGLPEAPIRMEGCFIGSNAQIGPGVRLGFGSFALGQIGPNVELPPFTLAFGGDPTTYRIGQVLTRLPDLVVTHFLNWTYQAAEQAEVVAVARLVESSIERGLAAIHAEQARRSSTSKRVSSQIVPGYLFDLTPYSDSQLAQGSRIYEDSLAGGTWRVAIEGEMLSIYQSEG